MFDIKSITIPISAGCYLMKDETGEIIYIGKAKNLRHRVSSYFRGTHDAKTSRMVSCLHAIEFFVVDNEIEALLLEAELIYKHKPKFNIDLKDSKRYAYIKITDEEYPRIISARVVNRLTDCFFGPYTDGSARREIIYSLNNIFKLRVCKKMPKRACLLFHIGRCSAPCENKISHEEYLKNIELAIRVLKGDQLEVIESLEVEMKKFSEGRSYERASVFRDRINAIKKLSSNQKFSTKRSYDQDFIACKKYGESLHIQILSVNKGVVHERETFDLEYSKNSFTDFIRQYYFSRVVPSELVVENDVVERALLEEYLSRIGKKKVRIVTPIRGIKKQLLNVVLKNVELRTSDLGVGLLELQKILTLRNIPRRIECFDISNLGDLYAVGAMVSFFDGEPDKSSYRKFKIKTVSAQDDFAMIAEVVLRRYTRLKNYGEYFPDLILIDGGPGQLRVALARLKELGVDIPIISLAKKQEVIHLANGGSPLVLSKKSEALKLLQRCRDEAHRFGLSYHRLLRAKGMLDS